MVNLSELVHDIPVHMNSFKKDKDYWGTRWEIAPGVNYFPDASSSIAYREGIHEQIHSRKAPGLNGGIVNVIDGDESAFGVFFEDNGGRLPKPLHYIFLGKGQNISVPYSSYAEGKGNFTNRVGIRIGPSSKSTRFLHVASQEEIKCLKVNPAKGHTDERRSIVDITSRVKHFTIPEGSSPELGHHYHDTMRERFAVLKGEFDIFLIDIDDTNNKERYTVNAGQFVEVPLRSAHLVVPTPGTEFVNVIPGVDFDPKDLNEYRIERF